MKILWVSPFLPKPDAPHTGGRILAQWIQWTAERHAVTLVCRIEPNERTEAETWRGRLEGLHLQEFRRPRGPLTTVRIAGSYVRLGRAANRLLRDGRYDLLHVEYLETGLGVDPALPVPKVAIAIDELVKPARHRLELARGPRARLGAWLYWRAIGRLQRRICRKFHRILAMSENDRRALLVSDPRLSVGVLPLPMGIDPTRAAGIRRDEAGLLFVGAMHRDANVDAVLHFWRDVLPTIRAAVPAATFTIAGGQPTSEVTRLASQPGIRVTGFVDSLEPYYAAATVFVAPMRITGGIAGKTIDALAAGCAVVTTTLGNDGLGAEPDTHLLIANTPDDFAAAVVRLLRDPGLRHRLGEAARSFASERHGAAVSAAALEREHTALAGSIAHQTIRPLTTLQ
jgi:glycosyltransferase involved in cell wall biosynthesis